MSAPRATRAQLVRRIAELGATLDESSGDVEVLAQPGTVFAGLGIHMLRIHPDASWTRAEIYGDLLSDLADGITPCECDDCHDAMAERDKREMAALIQKIGRP